MAEPFDELIDSLPSRFVVGIDLGTTNSAVTFVDTQQVPWSISVFNIEQPVSATEQERLDTLPSFYYQPVAGTTDFTACVGAYARDETAKTSGRGIASAKSWLCHSAVDRTAPILPWHAASDVRRLSPVEVSSAYLRHIRECWDREFPNHPLAEQDVVLTLPASFDEVARELTIESARQAGLPKIMLIEEPQAAFYAWVYKHQSDWDQRVSVGQKILVCDIGGGTTDFTLIRVRKTDSNQGASDKNNADNARIQFHRVAVGNHLILGGDNLDLAVAKYLEQKLAEGQKLAPYQWDLLVGSSRTVKEQLLSENGVEEVTVNIAGRGSRLIGGGIQVAITRQELSNLILEGFLPVVGLGERPQFIPGGFQELGLPYASDPAISRYLAQFLSTHATAGMDLGGDGQNALTPEEQRSAARPDVLLFNGGFFASPILRRRMVEQIAHWFRSPDNPNWTPLVLENDRLELAVARGAAYYGMVRRDEGIRIAATLARSYYLKIANDPPRAICIMPGSAEPGDNYELTDRTFRLTVSQPVEFSLYVSSVRLADRPSLLLDIDPEQLSPLPPIHTVLKTRSRNEKAELTVHLKIKLNEIGTVDLSCHEVGSDRSWKLEFDVRSTTQTHLAQHQGTGEAQGVYDESTWLECESAIDRVFGDDRNGAKADPKELVQELCRATGLQRNEWPMSLLRKIWGALLDRDSGRRISPQHEARWLNLLGFSLRPGYGLALDDWRVSETWRHVHQKLVYQTPAVRNELLILWRRISGGLTRGQQMMIVEPILASLRTLARQKSGKSSRGNTTSIRIEESAEVWRLLGSLEVLPSELKQEMGQLALTLSDKPRVSGIRNSLIWAVGRLGQRKPVYGPINSVLSPAIVESWITCLLKLQIDQENISHLAFALVQMSRLTNDRYREIDARLREKVIDWLSSREIDAHLVRLVLEEGQFEPQFQSQVFGDSLPLGLLLD